MNMQLKGFGMARKSILTEEGCLREAEVGESEEEVAVVHLKRLKKRRLQSRVEDSQMGLQFVL